MIPAGKRDDDDRSAGRLANRKGSRGAFPEESERQAGPCDLHLVGHLAPAIEINTISLVARIAIMASTQPSTSTKKVSSEDIISQKVTLTRSTILALSDFVDACSHFRSQTDLCISNAVVKTGIGFSAGVVLSVLLFRRE